ncbi:CDP-glycerol glycerophosphotransferase family protein [Candidatus Kaiserbacteria bacterium]|nr:CDP-glycerol glycerophosphotransferase family protein [Candidatus Kaiserbacteria bacterium]
MSKILTFLSICTSHLIYRLSFLVPKSPKLWVCIGWHTSRDREIFADNSKYMFLYLSQEQKDLRPIWLARDDKLTRILRDKGYEAYNINSFRGAWYALRSEYTIVDAFLERTFWKYTGGSKVVQLWHGKGMKKTGHDSSYSLASKSKFLHPNLFTPFHKLVASSDYTAKLMASTFNEPEEKILVTGLPRNDILKKAIKDADIDSNLELQGIIDNKKAAGAKKIFLYAPTFRPNGSNPIDSLDTRALQQVLEKNDFYLIISLHPKFARKEYQTAKAENNISYIASALDLYPQLKSVDALITDYSSLYVDYLLLDRPIIFYTYDIGSYRVDMGLHDSFEELTPGPHPKNVTELKEVITEPDKYQADRKRVREILYKKTDSEACSDIYKMLS